MKKPAMKILLANTPASVPLGSSENSKNQLEKYFVRAGSRWPFSVIKEKDQPLTSYLPFPFYLAYTTALLLREGYEAHAVDAIALNWHEEDFIQFTKELAPDLLLIESTTPTVDMDMQAIQKIKKIFPKIVICIAGSHATTYPKQTLEAHPEIDFVFQGEYEIPFLDFLKDYEKAKGEKRQLYQQQQQNQGLTSVAFIDEDKNYYQGEKGLITNLDDLPFPAWDHFPIKGKNPWDYYWDNICQYRPAAQMHSSRGCPFRCDFCVWIQVMYDDSKFRSFSPKRIVDEMEELQKRYQIKEIYFDDDIFTGQKKHVLEICQEIKARDLKIQWSAMGDAMVCDEEMIDRMSEAGLIGYKFGVESGDPRVLKEIQKPVKLEKVLKLADHCQLRGVKTHATFSFGLSGETRDSMENTLSFMKKLDTDTLQVSMATPFPGTRFYSKMVEQGNLPELSKLSEMDWKLFDGANSAVVSHPNLSFQEIQAFAKMARTRWLRTKLSTVKWPLRQIRRLIKMTLKQGIQVPLRMIKEGLRVALGISS